MVGFIMEMKMAIPLNSVLGCWHLLRINGLVWPVAGHMIIVGKTPHVCWRSGCRNCLIMFISSSSLY